MGSRDFSQTIDTTTGFKKDNAEATKVNKGFKNSISASLQVQLKDYGRFNGTQYKEFTQAFESAYNTKVENSKFVKTTTTFTAPPKTDYTVYQYKALFKDELGEDGFSFSGDFKIAEKK